MKKKEILWRLKIAAEEPIKVKNTYREYQCSVEIPCRVLHGIISM